MSEISGENFTSWLHVTPDSPDLMLKIFLPQ